MAAIWARVRAELHRRVAGTVLLMLFLGVAGGAVLGALAGARRTDTAFPRMREHTAAGDALISVGESGLGGFYDDVSELPEVIELGPAVGLDLFVTEGPAQILSESNELLPGFAALDDRIPYRVHRPRITAGRLPDPERPEEAFANRFLARIGVGVGTTLEIHPGFDEQGGPAGVPLRVTVVGTGIFDNEVLPIAANDSFPTLLLTPAYYQNYVEPRFRAFDGAYVRLRPGTEVTRFREKVEATLAQHPDAGELFFLGEEQRTDVIQRAVRPQVTALQLFAVLTALTASLLVGQALARQLYGDASDYPSLRALGMTQRQLLAVGMLRAALVGIGGAAIAVALAIATSPIMPLGTASVAEPDPGLAVNASLLALGGVAIVAVMMLVIAVPSRLRARPRGFSGAAEASTAGRSSRVASRLARSGAPTSLATGVRMAVDPGRGPTSAPVRSATIGTILAMVALSATVTFSSSLDRLVETPRLYGQTWDYTIDAGFGSIEADPATDRLRASPDVEAFAGGVVDEILVEEVPVAAIGIDLLDGAVTPTFLDGRMPRGTDEVALGARTMRRIEKRLGESTEVQVGNDSRTMRIVGTAVFPQLALGSFNITGLGDGALTTAAALPATEDEGVGYSLFLIRLKNPADAAARERVFRAAVGDIPECQAGFCGSSVDLRPGDVTNFARVRATPLVLAGLLALLAAAAIGHALVTSVRRRARELAILKTIGFLRGQVSATVAWQATTLAAISIAVGVPTGIAAGRAAWIGFADGLGVPPEPIVSMPAILIGIPVAVAIANAAAAFPGRRAARLRPAVVLRDE